MTKTQKFTMVPAMVAVLLTGGALATYAQIASAQSTTSGTSAPTERPDGPRGPHIHGTVASISGTTLTVTGKDGTTYTVNASSATAKKFAQGTGPTTIALSDIKVGDEVGVMGTISGTSVSATEIMDGVHPMGGRGMMGHGRGPGAMGEVTAINGSTITITGPDGKTTTVNASSASVERMVTGSLSDIKVGDRIGVQGSRSGTDITATHIMTGLPTPPANQ